MSRRNPLAETSKVIVNSGAPDAMVRLTDLLGETVMQFCHDHDDAVPGMYVIEIRQDGSLMSMKASAERWDGEAAKPEPPTLEALGDLYEQIAPSAHNYFLTCGEKPPLASDIFDQFVAAGFDMSMVERDAGLRVLQ